MTILKCTVCGGDLDIDTDLSVGICQYCDAKILIPKRLDKKGALYNRAVLLRQNNEFDKALDAYEAILRENSDDPEAHWGLVLSKYGIEYVEDPVTHERIPTCHRMQSDPIINDPDYIAACECSDDAARSVLVKEAQKIHDIYTKYWELSKKEPPYDIFICYKETDESGNRTQDSIDAQEIYYQLKNRGYNVFFARITLEKKLGTDYEPIIFSALSSAKVMIVVGSKKEYFNAVWVRNEWSRFRKLMKDHPEKERYLIPAFKNMTAYELPEELLAFQSLDMSRIGFMQDLLEGIDKYTGKNKKSNETSADSADSGFTKMIQNGYTFLKLNEYQMAESVFRDAVNKFPEKYEGWFGLVAVITKNFMDISINPDQYASYLKNAKKLVENNSKASEDIGKKMHEYECEKPLEAADEYLKATKYQEAEKLYQKISKLYPDDYRCWWGIVSCRTKDFTDISIGPDQYSSDLKNVKKLVKDNPRVSETIEKKMYEYECEKPLKTADHYLSSEHYSEAAKMYEQVSKIYPDDYRPWKGIVESVSSKHLHDEVFTRNDATVLQNNFAIFKKTADSKTIDEYTQKFLIKLQHLSKLIADNDINTTHQQKENDKAEILRQNIWKDNLKRLSQTDCLPIESQIKKHKRAFRHDSIKFLFNCTLCFIFTVMFVIGLYFIIIEDKVVLGGITALIGFILIALRVRKIMAQKKILSEYKNMIKKEKETLNNAKTKHTFQLSCCDNRIKELNENIAGYDSYLNNDPETIYDNVFTELCSMFDIQKE